jgi:hypothetical protein
MTTEAEKLVENAKLKLALANQRFVCLARAIANDYRRGHAPSPDSLRRLSALSDEETAAQKEEHDASAALATALEPRKARS